MKRSLLEITGVAVVGVVLIGFVVFGEQSSSDAPNDAEGAVAAQSVVESRSDASIDGESPIRSEAAGGRGDDVFAGLRRHSSATLRIESRVDGGRWETVEAISPLKGQRVELRVERVEGAHVRWLEIRPDTLKMYKNANFPWDPEPYKWIGLGKIDYAAREMVPFRDRWEIRLFEGDHGGDASTDTESKRFSESRGETLRSAQRDIKTDDRVADRFYHRDVGSFWFQVEVARDGRVSYSPGIESCDERGLSTKVFRVSVRDGEGYLGYLTSFHNVPGVFGSVTYQSHNFLGVDCADVLMAAYGRWKGKAMEKNYNVAMLVTEWPHVHTFDLDAGTPAPRTRWGDDVRPGDLVAVRYDGARQYQHVGALYRDANANAILDGEDLVLHAGPRPLQTSRLKEGSFDGHVVVMRPR